MYHIRQISRYLSEVFYPRGKRMKNNLKENLILFKRITAIALSLFMVAGILLTPVSTKAGDGDVIRIISYIDEEFSFYQDTTKLESNKYLPNYGQIWEI